jgi:hypothetical protein
MQEALASPMTHKSHGLSASLNSYKDLIDLAYKSIMGLSTSVLFRPVLSNSFFLN